MAHSGYWQGIAEKAQIVDFIRNQQAAEGNPAVFGTDQGVRCEVLASDRLGTFRLYEDANNGRLAATDDFGQP